MPKTDILDQSATRVELDQRSRDARLRLECVERLLSMRDLPRQSLLRRFLRRLGSRTRIGGQIAGRSMIAIASAGRASREREPAESGGGGDTLSVARSGGWLNCPRDARIGPGARDPALAPGVPVAFCLKSWHHWCGRGDFNSHIPSGNEILISVSFRDGSGASPRSAPAPPGGIRQANANTYNRRFSLHTRREDAEAKQSILYRSDQ